MVKLSDQSYTYLITFFTTSIILSIVILFCIKFDLMTKLLKICQKTRVTPTTSIIHVTPTMEIIHVKNTTTSVV